jgi:hypothetical protein
VLAKTMLSTASPLPFPKKILVKRGVIEQCWCGLSFHFTPAAAQKIRALRSKRKKRENKEEKKKKKKNTY